MADETIKSKEKITASVVDDLLTAIKTLYSNRNLTITENSESRNLKTINDSYEKTITAGNIINQSDLGDILDKVLIINDQPNLLKSSQYQNILADGTTNDILSWVNTYKDATETDTGHGCRGACVGICSGGCHSNAKGADGSSDRGTKENSLLKGNSDTSNGEDWSTGASCTAASCQAICSGCYTSCSGTCDGGCNKCSSSCSSNCSKRCSGFCDTTCGGCSGTCGKTCEGCGSACQEGCSKGCTGACQETCQNECALDCKSTCYGTTTGGTYT